MRLGCAATLLSLMLLLWRPAVVVGNISYRNQPIFNLVRGRLTRRQRNDALLVRC